ncbi:DUF2958 domain-containing protein [Ralstonia sp. 1138]|uniref:DUF2958 domain-containing protein n=1 Tax=Ralstonia sp. 1138 TaxID=3156423 RepID=UPI003391C270
MSATLMNQVAERMRDYPLGSQSADEDPTVIVKLFDVAGSATWWLTEYDPDEHVAYGYVSGIVADEWGAVSVEALSNLRVRFEIPDHASNPMSSITLHVVDAEPGTGIPRIELDLNFEARPISEVQAMLARYAATQRFL